MALTLSQLTTPMTPAEAQAALYTGMSTVGLTTTSWKPGAVVRTIVAVLALVLASLSRLIAAIARGGFLELAEGDWLTLLAFYGFGVSRETGSFATGVVHLHNTGGGSFTVAVGDMIVRNGASGKTYRNTASFSITSGQQRDVAVQAEELGTDSNASPHQINAFVTTFTGVTVDNVSAVLGTDPELDPALRERCREKTGVLSPNGPRDAYFFLSRSAKRADGAPVGVTRVRTIPDGIGGVDVYVANPAGTLTGDVDDETTDLGVVNRDIQEQAAPLAITARIHAATPLAVNVVYELWLRNTSGLTDDQVTDKIADALDDFFAAQPIGGEVIPSVVGKVYLSAIRGAISDVINDDVAPLIRLDVTTPAGDTSVGATQAPILGTVTPVVHQISSGVA